MNKEGPGIAGPFVVFAVLPSYRYSCAGSGSIVSGSTGTWISSR